MDRALSIGVEDVRPSRDVRSLLIPESPGFSHGEYVNKLEALAKYLEIDVEDINETNWGTLEADGGEYLVLTDEEADDKAYSNPEESLWAFNADFIIDMCGFSGGEKSLAAMQRESCEDCNEFIKAMVKGTCGLDSFVEAAIESDGRGHFIATYDFEEVEQGEYFIYRVD